MGFELQRLAKRKKALGNVRELLGQAEHVLVIHYSCESFAACVDGRTPRITSIAVRNLESAQTVSFSIHKVAEVRGIEDEETRSRYDELEGEMLNEFFDFVATQKNMRWVHWNMRDINYGFQAIEHRYKVLTNKMPPRVGGWEEVRSGSSPRRYLW